MHASIDQAEHVKAIHAHTSQPVALCVLSGKWTRQSKLWVWTPELDQFPLREGGISECQQPTAARLAPGWLWSLLSADL